MNYISWRIAYSRYYYYYISVMFKGDTSLSRTSAIHGIFTCVVVKRFPWPATLLRTFQEVANIFAPSKSRTQLPASHIWTTSCERAKWLTGGKAHHKPSKPRLNKQSCFYFIVKRLPKTWAWYFRTVISVMVGSWYFESTQAVDFILLHSVQ